MTRLPSEQRRVIQTTQQRRLVLAPRVYVIAWLVAVVEILISDVGGWVRRAVVVSLIVGHLVFILWLARRFTRAGVLAGPRDVIVCNPLGSVRLDWGEIERFAAEPAGPWTMGYAQLRDGSSVRIFGIQGQRLGLFPSSPSVEDPIDELNRLLEESRN